MTKTDKKIIISGYYGFGNTGDEAILSAMVSALKNSIPGAEIVVLSQDIPHTSSHYNVRAVVRRNPLVLARELMDAKLFISGGGGLIQDVTGVSTIQYYLGLVLIAKLMRKKVMYYAQGIGPINTEEGRRYTRFISNMVDLITVRDDESKEELKKIGISKTPIIVTADPVLALEPASRGRIDEILRNEGIGEEKTRIAISIRPWKTTVDYLSVFAECADRLKKELNAEIVLVPFQKSQDLEVCEKVKALMKEPAVLLQGDYRPEELQGLLGAVDLVIGMRLHSLIFAATQSVPMIGVVYDPKVKVFSDSIGALSHPLEKISVQELCSCAEKVYNNREEVKARLKKEISELKIKALKTAHLAGRLIECRGPVRSLEEI